MQARAIAGAVFLPIGSSRYLLFFLFNSSNWSRAKKYCSVFETINCELHTLEFLSTVNWNSDLSSNNFENCFGISVRLIGHSLVPFPPHNITFVTVFSLKNNFLYICVSLLYLISRPYQTIYTLHVDHLILNRHLL